MSSAPSERGLSVLGRYVVYEEIASGGMATVHLGRVRGAAGFARTVAVKRLHRQYAKDPDFVAMLVDEARLAGRIHHPNVVTVLDVAAEASELVLVMEYVHGEPLARLLRAARQCGQTVAPRIAARILIEALHGLHAAHEARDERGVELFIVHRDVSPQNIIVGADGVSRVLDFGIAKASGKIHTTRDGEIKGKFAYMPPEQLNGSHLDRRADVYSAGVVLWETLTGERLFLGTSDMPNLQRLLDADVDAPSTRVRNLPASFDAVVLKALARKPEDRYPTARAMAHALEECGPAATASEVSAWVESLVGESLIERADLITRLEGLPDPVARSTSSIPPEPRTSVTPDAPPVWVQPSPRPHSSEEETVNYPRPGALDHADATTPGPQPAADTTPVGLSERLEMTGSRATVTPIRPRAPRRPAVLAIALLAVTLLLVTTLWSRPQAMPSTAQEAATPAPSSASPEPPASAPAPEVQAPVVPTIASVMPLASARPRVLKRPTKPDLCSPPFLVDEQGHKHFKRECL